MVRSGEVIGSVCTVVKRQMFSWFGAEKFAEYFHDVYYFVSGEAVSHLSPKKSNFRNWRYLLNVSIDGKRQKVVVVYLFLLFLRYLECR